LYKRGQGKRASPRIPFEPGTPVEGANLTHEDDASKLKRRPSPGYRNPTIAKVTPDEWRSDKIMAISGHQTLAEVTRYTVAANRVHLAERAVAALERKEAGT